jgi:hypothetical protein
MFSIPVLIGTIAAVVWSFSEPAKAGWAFIIAMAVFEAWLLAQEWLARRRMPVDPSERFDDSEVEVLRKYPVYFAYPFSAVSCSNALAYATWGTVFLAVRLVFVGQWWLAAIIALNYLIYGPLMVRLNPVPAMQRSAKREPSMLSNRLAFELSVVEDIWKKLKASGGEPAAANPTEA